MISPLAILLSGLSNMIIGFLWYGPLFAKPWMKELGLKDEDVKNGPGVGYLFTLLAAFLAATVTSYLVHTMNISEVLEGASLGLMLGVGYVGTTFLTNYIFAQKSFKLFAIDAGYQIMAITVSAIICTLIK